MSKKKPTGRVAKATGTKHGTPASEHLYKPNEKEVAVITSVLNEFRSTANDRNRNFAYFDGINLIDYINDSVVRFTTNVDEREDIEDWQARIHDPITRTKVLTILGKVIQVLPMGQFRARGEEDFRKAEILNTIYEFSEDLDDYEELMLFILLEAVVKGTAIGYEGVEKQVRTLRDVSGYGDEMTVKEVEEVSHKLCGYVIPLEEFYPQSVSIRNIKMMDYCFWRSEYPYSKFKTLFQNYALSEVVSPHKLYAANESKPFYADLLSGITVEGNVEVIRKYDKVKDEFIIIANGVWLNPLTNKNGTVTAPLPFNHKELPFWDIKFDFFGSDFFYGKSLPDRLKSLQDVLNVLNNMLLDQSFLSIFAPYLTAGYDQIEDDFLRPGRRTSIDTQGMPLSQSFMRLDPGTPSGWHQYILEYTTKIMEKASFDQVSSGQAGVGGRTTAVEIRTAADGVSSLLGLFGRFVNYGVKRKALLRGANILQVWTDPKTPFIQKVLGDDAQEFNKAFNTFKVDNAKLSDGRRGTRVIEMYADPESRPTVEELKNRSLIHEAATDKPIEIIAVVPEYIRDMQTDVAVVMNPKKEATKDMDRAMALEKAKIYTTMFPDLINRRELAAKTMEKMGDEPEELLIQEQKPAAPGAAPEGTPESQMDISGQMAHSAGGGADSVALRDLQKQMIDA